MKKLLIVSLVTFFAILFINRGLSWCAEVIYTYDDLNRLERLEKPDEYIIEYYYDIVGNRTSKIIMVTSPVFDSDDDNDVDGVDLYEFLTNWDQSPQSLSDFANRFGTIE